VVLPVIAQANPKDGQVVAGSATITQSGHKLTITQSTPDAVINWQGFSINTGETTIFSQPSASSISLNRVTGADPSAIRGNLAANGQVWLVNPNGIVFGKSARVDVAGLLATTIDIADPDFMGGRYRFNDLGNPGTMVTNAGRLTIGNAGLAALVAPGVENSGVIRANLGQIQLSSTAAFTVDLYGDGLFNFTLDKQVTQAIVKPNGAPPSAAVSNTGGIIAPGGHILLTANAASSVVSHAINMGGYAQATTAAVSTGVITLDGGDSGTVQVNGRLDASGTVSGQSGGTVQVTGSDVDIAPTGKIDVSGDTGGGTALIGGDLHGGGSLRNAAATTIAPGASIAADAGTRGNGGSVIVWSDDHTSFQGAISAKGGSGGGEGGSADVSSHRMLDFNGTVDLRAPSGHIGTLLLDPEDVTISATGDTPSLPGSSNGPITLSANADDSTLAVATLQNALALADVTVSTGSTGSQAGDITVATNINWSGRNALTLSAFRNITINANITNTGGAAVNLQADNTGTGIGTVTFGGGSVISTSGAVSIFYNPSVNPAGSGVNPTSYVGPTEAFTADVNGEGVLIAYMLVNSIFDLQNIQNNLSGNYAIGRDIDASNLANFTPLGEFTSAGYETEGFTGILDGRGHSIAELTIREDTNSLNVGLFRTIGNATGPAGNGLVENLNLTNVTVVGGTNNSASIGALAGTNYGIISNVSSEGSVTPGSDDAYSIGGLVGGNEGTITLSHSSGVVSAGSDFAEALGGLVGTNAGTISQSYSLSSVSDASSFGGNVGGLVGINSAAQVSLTGSITASYAVGTVTTADGGSNYYYVGGLVGNGAGTIVNSYATGAVHGQGLIVAGGLVGDFVGGPISTISNSYATGAVTDTNPSSYSILGGLVADFLGGLAINSYWDTQTTGQNSSPGGGVGLTSAQLQSGLPTGFDPAIWTINAATNSGYPFFQWQAAGNTTVLPGNVINFGGLSLTILSWQVSSVSSVYGSLPTLGSASLIGVLPADKGLVLPTIELLKGSTPVTLSPTLDAGTYTEEVVAITGTAASQYTLATSGNTLGTLTIDPKALTWSVADATSVFGTVPTPGNASLVGRVGSDDVSGVVGVFDGAIPINLSVTTPVGIYSERVVTLSGAAANNYTLAPMESAEGTFQIAAPSGLVSLISQIGNPSVQIPIASSNFNVAALIQKAESMVSASHLGSPVSSDPSFEDLLLALGLNTKYETADGGYISPLGYEPRLNRQCVALVAALTGINSDTRYWTPGLAVVPPTAAGPVQPGVPIATFDGGHYSKTNEHAAIFLGYHTTNGIIDGMYLIDQYDLTQIGENNPQSGPKPAEIRFYPIKPSSPRYFVIQN
jgi:filamentous hemagglutinin family protein